MLHDAQYSTANNLLVARPINTTPLTTDQQKLAADNVRLAYKFASKNPVHGLDFEEVVSICLMGLVRAARLFNPNRARFSTFAYKCMRSAICADIKAQTYDNRIINKLATPFATNRFGRLIEPADPKSDSDAAESNEAAFSLRLAMERLEDRDAMVLRWRFFDGLTLSQVGEKLGITRERVRQIQVEALTELRRILDKKWRPGPGARKLAQMERQRKATRMNLLLAMAV